MFRNTIVSSANNGILLAANSNSNTLVSNYLGLDVSGNIIPNLQNGVYISPNSNTNKLNSNVISGNILNGIEVAGNGTQIKNNYIGVDATNAAKAKWKQWYICYSR